MTLLWLCPHWASPDQTAVLQISAALQQAAEEEAGLLLDTAGAEEEQVNTALIEAAWVASENGIDIGEIACHGADCQTGLLGALLKRHQACLQEVKQNTDLQQIPEPLATQLVDCLQQFPQQWQPSAQSLAIIVPTYNCASKIERTLQSIEESIQFFHNHLPFSSLYDVEVVIVDDASTDDTDAVVQNYISDKTYFQFVYHRFNRGAGIARNTGVNFSQGEILFFCDGDDLFLEKHLLLGVLALEISLDQPQILDRLLEYAGISLDQEITSYIRNINGRPPYGFVSLGVKVDEDILLEWHQRIVDSLPINLVIRRSVFQFVEGFPTQLVYQRLRCTEDVALRDCLYRFCNGIQVNVETTQYLRYPGNSLDRQLRKFQSPLSEAASLETSNLDDLQIENHLRLAKINFLLNKAQLTEDSVKHFIVPLKKDQKTSKRNVQQAYDLETVINNCNQKKARAIAFDWLISTYTGWGVFGTNFILQLHRQRQSWFPIYLKSPYLNLQDLHPLTEPQFLDLPVFDPESDDCALKRLNQGLDQKLLILQSMMNNFQSREYEFPFEQRAGLIFMEDTYVTSEGMERAKRFPVIISGSTWCNDLVTAHYQGNAYAIPQGVDPALFQPSQTPGYFSDRFVIFSGGKLEYRKGQDIVIEAFKRFHQQYPEALLLCNWSTALPQYMNGLQHAGYVQGLPKTEGDLKSNLGQWMIENGLPEDSFYCLGFTPNLQMPYVLREAHAAIFPNRAEGGTNLVAMEAIACGIPTLLSKNTGHLDLINLFGIDALESQNPVKPHQPYIGTEGWGQSDPDEVVAWLEKVYQNYQEQKKKALEHSVAIRQTMSWEIQIRKMTDVITNHLEV
ncbi:glycosyltransferase [Synechococcus elongatus IITB4]|uniref:glycosyltransferase n=1 Tax=Synechococcus elongatus TaxID=32046 RepID=UPI0030D37E26